MSQNNGRISQIIGPVVDVTFENNEAGLPDIYDSLEITKDNGTKLILECQAHRRRYRKSHLYGLY